MLGSFISYKVICLLRLLPFEDFTHIACNLRTALFLEETYNTFTRKDYINRFKELSPATASRDLKKTVKKNG